MRVGLALVVMVLVLADGRPAEACKLEGWGALFETSGVGAASLPADFTVTAHVRHDIRPPACGSCLDHTYLTLHFENVDPERWGALVTVRGEAPFRAPSTPMRIPADGNLTTGWFDDFFWRSGFSVDLEVALVDAHGHRTVPVTVRASDSLALPWSSWTIVGLAAAALTWRASRRRSARSV